MKNRFKIGVIFSLILVTNSLIAQTFFIPIPVDKIPSDYEHGFLPGGKFKYYKLTDTYNFNDKKIRVELIDKRCDLNLSRIGCSDIDISNTSEFKDPKSAEIVKTYIDTLFKQSHIQIDPKANDTLLIFLEATDVRLLGFTNIQVHGLCQMSFKYKGFEKQYCIDINDGDDNSPLGKYAFVTRRKATRSLYSAAIRDALEKFLIDFSEMTD